MERLYFLSLSIHIYFVDFTMDHIDNHVLFFDILESFYSFLEELQLLEVMFFHEVKEAFEVQLLLPIYFQLFQVLVTLSFNFFEVDSLLTIQH